MLALTLREAFLDAEIVCAEVFPFFKGHLASLGFTVIDANTMGEMGMKFDLVIGNPPYQSQQAKALWPLFVYKGSQMLSDDGILAMITPNKWCGHSPTNAIKGKIHLYRDIFRGKLVACNIQECSKYFPKIGGYENCFSYFIIDNSGSDSFEVIGLNETVTIDKNQFEYLPISHFDSRTASILKKTDTNKNFNFKQVATGFTNKNNGSIVISMAQRLHYLKLNIYYDKDSTYPGTSKSMVSKTVFDNSSQEKVESVFRSNLFKFLHKIYWNGDNFGTSFYNSLPYLDLNVLWTDTAIYQHFNLTQEEIDYLEASI